MHMGVVTRTTATVYYFSGCAHTQLHARATYTDMLARAYAEDSSCS